MKAIAIKPGSTEVRLTEVPEPELQRPDEIKMKMIRVGICGTDREEVSGGRADAPEGKNELVLGHEMFGEVVAVGEEVKTARPGDYGVFLVRRGCGTCSACQNGRSDMCFTGNYTERGIKGADGFQAQYVVDQEAYFVKVPQQLQEIGVLTEPMSVAAKAIDEAQLIQQARLKDFGMEGNWFAGKKALVAGIGAIGLLAAFALRLRGAEVIGMDIVDENSRRPGILKSIGGRYVDGRTVAVTDLDKVCGDVDFIFEAAGIARLQVQLVDALGTNGIYVATGIPGGNRPLDIPADALLRQLVLRNQVILGSVNASLRHYRMAVDDLQACLVKWPGVIQSLITEKFSFQDFNKALHHHSEDEIKVVIEWN